MLALLMFFGLAVATAQDADPPPEILEAVRAWSQCDVSRADDLASRDEPIETVTDAVVSACAAQAQVVVDLLAGLYGDASAELATELRAQHRQIAASAIAERRGISVPISPLRAYGRCTGRRTGELARGPEAAETIVERVRSDCAIEEQAAIAFLRREDPSTADQQIASILRQERAEILQDIQEIRRRR